MKGTRAGSTNEMGNGRERDRQGEKKVKVIKSCRARVGERGHDRKTYIALAFLTRKTKGMSELLISIQ